ncbi:MAG: hypothetical protein KQJ78_14185 [Deltaproteobacteria bacterium]|nr:hypothetical protein [Deltaproteobacteria bacterium]
MQQNQPPRRWGPVIQAGAKGLAKSLVLSGVLLGSGLLLTHQLQQPFLGWVWMLLGSFAMMAWTYRRQWRLLWLACLSPPLVAAASYLTQIAVFGGKPDLLWLGGAALAGLVVGIVRGRTHEVFVKGQAIYARRTIGYLFIWLICYLLGQFFSMLGHKNLVNIGRVSGAFSTAMLLAVSLMLLAKYANQKKTLKLALSKSTLAVILTMFLAGSALGGLSLAVASGLPAPDEYVPPIPPGKQFYPDLVDPLGCSVTGQLYWYRHIDIPGQPGFRKLESRPHVVSIRKYCQAHPTTFICRECTPTVGVMIWDGKKWPDLLDNPQAADAGLISSILILLGAMGGSVSTAMAEAMRQAGQAAAAALQPGDFRGQPGGGEAGPPPPPPDTGFPDYTPPTRPTPDIINPYEGAPFETDGKGNYWAPNEHGEWQWLGAGEALEAAAALQGELNQRGRERRDFEEDSRQATALAQAQARERDEAERRARREREAQRQAAREQDDARREALLTGIQHTLTDLDGDPRQGELLGELADLLQSGDTAGAALLWGHLRGERQSQLDAWQQEAKEAAKRGEAWGKAETTAIIARDLSKAALAAATAQLTATAGVAVATMAGGAALGSVGAAEEGTVLTEDGTGIRFDTRQGAIGMVKGVKAAASAAIGGVDAGGSRVIATAKVATGAALDMGETYGVTGGDVKKTLISGAMSVVKGATDEVLDQRALDRATAGLAPGQSLGQNATDIWHAASKSANSVMHNTAQGVFIQDKGLSDAVGGALYTEALGLGGKGLLGAATSHPGYTGTGMEGDSAPSRTGQATDLPPAEAPNQAPGRAVSGGEPEEGAGVLPGRGEAEAAPGAGAGTPAAEGESGTQARTQGQASDPEGQPPGRAAPEMTPAEQATAREAEWMNARRGVWEAESRAARAQAEFEADPQHAGKGNAAQQAAAELRTAQARETEAARSARDAYEATRGGGAPPETPADREAAASAAHRDSRRVVWEAEQRAARARAEYEADPGNTGLGMDARAAASELRGAEGEEMSAALDARDAYEARRGGGAPEAPPTGPPDNPPASPPAVPPSGPPSSPAEAPGPSSPAEAGTPAGPEAGLAVQTGDRQEVAGELRGIMREMGGTYREDAEELRGGSAPNEGTHDDLGAGSAEEGRRGFSRQTYVLDTNTGEYRPLIGNAQADYQPGENELMVDQMRFDNSLRVVRQGAGVDAAAAQEGLQYLDENLPPAEPFPQTATAPDSPPPGQPWAGVEGDDSPAGVDRQIEDLLKDLDREDDD